MGASVGEIDLDLRVNQSGFNRQLKGIQAMAKNVGAAIASAFAVRVVINFGKTCISTATEVENAWVGLNSIINGQGKSFNNAKKFIQEYISDGLVPLKNAVIAYKNLSLRGYNEEQIQKVMNALKNSATYARQSQYSLGDAISTATEGLKNENSIVVDNAGVTKNVAKMWEDYAKSIGVSYTSLTKEQKIQAEVNGILEETKFQMGDAEKYANTYSGKVAKLSASFTNLKVKIGNILKVIAGAFIPVINNAIKVVEKFIDGITALLNSFGIQTNIVDTLKDVSETAEGSSNNIDGITESAKEAEKAVNRLMGFDEINLLSKDDSSANSDNTNSGDGSVDMSGIADETKETKSKLNNFFIPFQQSWQKQGEKTVNSIKKALNNITKLVKSIRNSFAEVWNNGSGEKFCENILRLIQAWADKISVVSNAFNIAWNTCGLGTAIVQGIFNIMNNMLEIIIEIGESFNRVWSEGIGVSICKNILETMKNIVETISEIQINWLNAWNDNGTGDSLIRNYLNLLNSITELLSHVTEGIKNSFGKATETLFPAVIEFTTKIGEGLKNITDGFKIVWDNGGKILFDGIVQLADQIAIFIMKISSNVFADFSIVFKEILAPAIGKVADVIGNVLKKLGEFLAWINSNSDTINILTKAVEAFFIAWAVGKIKKFIDLSGGLCGALVQIATKLASTTLAQNLYNIAQGVGNVLTTAWNGLCVIASGVTTALGIAFNFLCSPIGLVTLAITGAIAVGVLLYKNWDTIKEKASELWGNIKNIFDKIKDKIKSVCDSIKSFFKGMINFVVEVINKLINGINKISIDVPDWDILPDSIQGKSFSPNISKLPMLADGGFVKANTPQLAMIGDNKHQGEVVAPENKLSELLDKAVSKGSADEETLYRAFLRALNDMPRQQTEVKIGENTLMWIIINGLNKIIKQNGGVCPINI